jgi:peroxiredoxin
MAVPSTMLELGTPLPDFSLPDVVGNRSVSSSELARPLVIAIICNHCPYVRHILGGLVELARDYAEKGVALVAISSNDVVTYPQDGPAAMAAEARQQGFAFPYLYDESQAVARAFRAACTPEFYVFDKVGKLAYRGQFDDSRPNNGKPVTGADVRAAVDALLAGKTPAAEQTPSVGCSIKWKAGNVPDYT